MKPVMKPKDRNATNGAVDKYVRKKFIRLLKNTKLSILYRLGHLKLTARSLSTMEQQFRNPKQNLLDNR
jgi:hypothetical protein